MSSSLLTPHGTVVRLLLETTGWTCPGGGCEDGQNNEGRKKKKKKRTQVERVESRWCDDEGKKEERKRPINARLQVLQDSHWGGVYELALVWYSSTHTASYKGETALLLLLLLLLTENLHY